MAIRAVAELKKELEKLVGALLEEDEDEEITDNAIQTLCALKDLKLNRQSFDQEFVNKNLGFLEPPQEFKCPISGILMKDPVVLASGQTYEAAFIQDWLKDGHNKCPYTDQPLPHTLLIPNHSIKKMIMNWCKTRKIDTPVTSSLNGDDKYAANANREHLIELLDKLSSSSSFDQTMAAKELRSLTTRFPYFRALFGDVKVMLDRLFNPILIRKAYSDARLHDDLIATTLNIATHENNKRRIVESHPFAVSFLIESLSNECIEMKMHAVAALSELSTVDSNKHILGKSGTIRPLIRIMQEGNPPALKDAVSAILNLCTLVENRERAACEGAVVAIVDKIVHRVLVSEMLEILALLSGHQRAMDEMDECGVLRCLFGLLKEEISDRNEELCVAIVYAMCFGDRTKLRRINEVENAYETLCRVARKGTSRAKRKASGILERMNRFAFLSHTA